MPVVGKSIGKEVNAISKGKMIYGLLGFISAGLLFTSGTVSADSSVYVVKEGDTLSEIAYDNDISLNKLAEDNNIENVNTILIGDKIILDGNVTVQSNDTDVEVVTDEPETVTPQVEPAVTPEATPVTKPVVTTSSALDILIQRESGGNVNATNGQYFGLGQLSPQARAVYGGNSSDYNDQLNAMKAYIAARYGTAENALAHSNATGWY